MRITGRLFLSPRFHVAPASIVDSEKPSRPALSVRLFSKSDRIDSQFHILTDDWESFRSALPLLSSELENCRILSIISGKKIYLRLREELQATAFRPGENLVSIPFRPQADREPFSARLIIPKGVIGDLFRILGENPPEDPVTPEALRKLDKLCYRKLASPPDDLAEILVFLPDRDIQLLLNHILHKNIASTDMLAAYIHSLGDQGNRIIQNLSKSTGREVTDKVKRARIFSTYRWAEEVRYIINRNMLIAARELDLPMRGIEILEFVRRGFETAVALEHLSVKSVTDWLEDFRAAGRLRDLLNGTGRNELAAGLTFADEKRTVEILAGELSQNGLKLLMEDREAAFNLPDSRRTRLLTVFLRSLKDAYFTPYVEKVSFEDEVTHSVTDGADMDLIADEIGFAKAVYALKPMPKDWTDRVLCGTFRNIFEDVTGGLMKIRDYGDYRIPECRLEFLKALYILCEEEKI